MHTETLTIDRTQVYEEIAKQSQYTGQKSQEGGEQGNTDFERIGITEAEQEFFDEKWDVAIKDVVVLFNDYLPMVSSHDDEYTISFQVPDNYNTANNTVITDSIKGYLVNALLSQWYQITIPSLAEGTASAAQAHMDAISLLLNSRKKPEKRDLKPKSPYGVTIETSTR